jgi:hypothetical protein
MLVSGYVILSSLLFADPMGVCGAVVQFGGSPVYIVHSLSFNSLRSTRRTNLFRIARFGCELCR